MAFFFVEAATNTEILRCLDWEGLRRDTEYILKSSPIETLHGKFSGALTFESFCQKQKRYVPGLWSGSDGLLQGGGGGGGGAVGFIHEQEGVLLDAVEEKIQGLEKVAADLEEEEEDVGKNLTRVKDAAERALGSASKGAS
jgi:hypothetical protein